MIPESWQPRDDRATMAPVISARRADGNGPGIDGRPRTVSLAHLDLWRRQCQQAGDGVSRALDRPGFDELGKRVQGHHHRSFGPLADDERASHRNGHQRVDVQLSVQQCAQPLAEHAESRQRDSACGDGHPHHVPREGARREEMNQFRSECHGQGGHEAQDLCTLRLRRVLGRRRCGERLGLEASRVDGCDDRLPSRRRGVDAQGTSRQVEAKASDFGEALQRTTYLALLGRAVHRRNAKKQAARTLSGHGGWRNGTGAASAIVEMDMPLVMMLVRLMGVLLMGVFHMPVRRLRREWIAPARGGLTARRRRQAGLRSLRDLRRVMVVSVLWMAHVYSFYRIEDI